MSDIPLKYRLQNYKQFIPQVAKFGATGLQWQYLLNHKEEVIQYIKDKMSIYRKVLRLLDKHE